MNSIKNKFTLPIIILTLIIVLTISIGTFFANITISRQQQNINTHVQSFVQNYQDPISQFVLNQNITNEFDALSSSLININILILIFLLIFSVITITVITRGANKLNSKLQAIQDYLQSLIKGKPYLNPLPSFMAIDSSIDELSKTYQDFINTLKASVVELETVGFSKSRFKNTDFNNTLNSATLNKSFDNINEKITTISKNIVTDSKNVTNINTWEYISTNLLNQNEQFKNYISQSKSITSYLEKINKGNLGIRLNTNEDQPLLQHINSLVAAFDKFINEIDNISLNDLSNKLNEDYPLYLSNIKYNFNNAITKNNNNLTQLKSLVDELQNKEKQKQQNISNKVNSNSHPKSSTTNYNAKDIDFTGRSFGKY